MSVCADCLNEFSDESKKFAVLKQVQSARYAPGRESLRRYPAIVCAECVGQYKDTVRIDDSRYAD
jgi:hypothetical protein